MYFYIIHLINKELSLLESQQKSGQINNYFEFVTAQHCPLSNTSGTHDKLDKIYTTLFVYIFTELLKIISLLLLYVINVVNHRA